jgi:hypothetical protein
VTVTTEPFDVDAAIAAEFRVQSNTCQTCLWLSTLDPTEAAKWDANLARKDVPHSAIFRAAKKRGFPRGEGSIEGHRKNLHTVADRTTL